jgi:hypothetical protein
MRSALFALLAWIAPIGLSAQQSDRLHVTVRAGDKARAGLEAIRFVDLMSRDSLGVASCALEGALGTDEYRDVARPQLEARLSTLSGSGCDAQSYQVRRRPVIYVEKVTELRSNKVLPVWEQISFEVTLQVIRGEVQEWQVIKVRPLELDYSEPAGNTIRSWRVVKFEVTRYMQSYFRIR